MCNEMRKFLPQEGADGKVTLVMSTTGHDTVSLGLRAFENPEGCCGFIGVRVSAAGTTLTLKVQGQDIIGNWYDVPGAVFGAITGTGYSVLQIGPGLPVTSGLSANALLPEKWRLIPSAITGSFTLSEIVVQYLDC